MDKILSAYRYALATMLDGMDEHDIVHSTGLTLEEARVIYKMGVHAMNSVKTTDHTAAEELSKE